MSLAAALLYSVVTLWLVITLLAQHSRFQPFINAFNALHIIPRWTFFAPNPGVRDYHLVIRDRCSDGCVTGWKSVPVYSPRPRFGYLWNPQKRSSKIMNDAVQAIKLLSKRENIGAAGIPFTAPYLLLLYYAAHAVPPEPDAIEFQIAIIESTGHDKRELECSFLSSFHGR
jgi:hypothetical protein